MNSTEVRANSPRCATLLMLGVLSFSWMGDALAQATAGAVAVNGSTNRCSRTKGTLAIDDGRTKDWMGYFSRITQITTLEPLIRAYVQQSNCFVITSVGNRQANGKINDIQRAQSTGDFRPGSEMGPNQRVAADYFLEPSVIFKEPEKRRKSGFDGVIGGVFGRMGLPAPGDIVNVDQIEATVTLALWDLRSGVLVSSAIGKKKVTNVGGIVGEVKGLMTDSEDATEGLIDYSSTPDGKATAAAFLQSFNDMTIALESYRPQTVKGGLGTGGTLKIQDE